MSEVNRKAYKCELTRINLPQFISWLKQNGWTIGEPKGAFVVLRARKDIQFITLYGGFHSEQLSYTKRDRKIVNDFLGGIGHEQCKP